MDQGRIVGEALNYARTLANAPGNLLYPLDLANEAKKLAEDGVEVEVLEAPRLLELGMGGILGVGGGSDHPPALALMRYRGGGDKPFLGLVGKGVTFDSGGISIKPSQDMHEMKTDMAGAAAVLGAIQAIARLKLRVNVLGVIATVENLPSSHSYRPGDVLTSYSGKTIEILNTDAEGRVILADAVAYAVEQGASRLVDAATLTGAAIIALGHVATAVIGRPQAWVDRVLEAARVAGEKMWQLPIYDEYKELIRSQVADVANSGGRPAGTITGGLFIGEFVEESVPWVHLDIAGTDSTSKELPYAAKGPLGTPLRTFVELALMEER
jgi:leucyl aminopeptidase